MASAPPPSCHTWPPSASQPSRQHPTTAAPPSHQQQQHGPSLQQGRPVWMCVGGRGGGNKPHEGRAGGGGGDGQKLRKSCWVGGWVDKGQGRQWGWVEVPYAHKVSTWPLGTQGPLQMVYNCLAVTPTMSIASSTWAVLLIPAAHGTASYMLGSPKPGLGLQRCSGCGASAS